MASFRSFRQIAEIVKADIEYLHIESPFRGKASKDIRESVVVLPNCPGGGGWVSWRGWRLVLITAAADDEQFAVI
ncbi:hypothetical protein L1987_81579 [Smallanthus sonchifolius]|uniref:Uncharacterized protein n=1 Tax=Smallanthus sonchifolius TaxID=185202 RepID=A0ACB8YQZ8_9ASTR|nr:hypothetical protein L1987_81579 [Smallanthus sonchifolius]